jgi:hypothetical protein
MKICKTLPEIVENIKTTHRFLHNSTGIYGIKLLRKANGKRYPFEEIKGLRIQDFSMPDKNTLVIEQVGLGFQFKSNVKHIYTAKLYLSNLAVINVYDERAEFFTVEGIDFCYIHNDYVVNVKMLKEWVNNDPGIVRARWINENDDVQKLLEDIGGDINMKRSDW